MADTRRGISPLEYVNIAADLGGDDRLHETLQRLLAVQAIEMRPILDEASSLVASALWRTLYRLPEDVPKG